VLAAATVVASPAHAGYWMRSSCINPGGSSASSEGWSGIANDVGYGSTHSVACAPGSPMFAMLSTAAWAPVGAHQTLVYTPPEGSRLSGGLIGVDLLADGRGYNASGVAVVYTPAFAYDGSNVVFQCASGLSPCANGSNHYAGPIALPANRGGSLYVSASCGGQPGGACNTGGSDGVWARVQVQYANLLLHSNFAPSGSDFSGSLLSPGAHGTASLSFIASVPGGPGIYKVTTLIDGKPVYDGTPNTNSGRCAPIGVDSATGAMVFGYQEPCVRTQTVDLTVRTTTLRDGPHELVVVVTDAAQNAQTVLRQPITVNNRTTASSTLTSDPPQVVGGAMPVPGGTTPAAPEPAYALALDTRTRRFTRGVRNVWAQSAIRLSGTLRSSSGGPAPTGVPVVVFAKSAIDTTARIVARATTNKAGQWTLRAPRGPSRTLTISYGARPDPTAANAIKIRQSVRPRISLHVQVLGRGALRFTGSLHFEPLGSPRPIVDIQVFTIRQRFDPFGRSIRVSPTGTFSGKRFVELQNVGYTYAFRVVARGNALLATGSSKILRVLVR
jgi:hypothetical protein